MDHAMVSSVARKEPEVEPTRAALVARWLDRMRHAEAFWRRPFERMREDMAFAAGKQWASGTAAAVAGSEEQDYVANVVLRHIQQATAGLYGKNPRVVARRKRRLLSTIWDGTAASLMQAQQALTANPADQNAFAVLADAVRAQQEVQLYGRMAETLELVYEHNIEEQINPFKVGLKGVVRKTLTTGVGYVKLGFQRVMQRRPEVEQQIADASERLSTIERLAADLADGEIAKDSAEVEQLRLTIKALSEDAPMIVREGLVVDYPDSTSILPDPRCKQLRGFVGCRWVAEKFYLSGDDIKEIYKVDVAGTQAKAYVKRDAFADIVASQVVGDTAQDSEDALFCVYVVFSRPDGLVYTVCDGYADFLEEPRAPDVWMERFWPWFVFVKNEVYHDGSVFPPSDVRLIRDAQMEMNRARQGLREQRRANRPKIATPAGMLDETDKEKLQSHPANALIELQALQPGQAVDAVLQPIKMPPIDPSLYDTGPAMEDILRIVGAQEANLGGTSGATATETSIAESSRMTAGSSAVDDLDEMLTEFARAAGQILLTNLSADTVREIVGPGAVWPELSKEQVAKEIYLEIEAASTGRPNRAAEVQNATQLAPIIMQIPGISPEWFAREMIRRLDDRLDPAEAIVAGMPSMAMLNRSAQTTAAAPENDPNMQGQQGGDNVRMDPRQVNAAPRAPQAPTTMPV